LFSLIPIAALTGVGMLLIFRRTSDQAALSRTKKLLQAHLLELRLFADEPSLVWRAQKDLLRLNGQYLRLMLRPMLWAIVPMALLLAQLDGIYGRAALAIGQAAIVTVQMRAPLRLDALPPVLEAPAGILVETPAVRVLSDNQVSWRIRPLREVSGRLRILLPGETLEKSVQAGGGLRRLSSRRVCFSIALLWRPEEWPLRTRTVEWIEVGYPAARIHVWGTNLHWLIWFVAASMLSAWVLRKRFRMIF
jgi:uncharacterized membrane protein (DUF106 family)